MSCRSIVDATTEFGGSIQAMVALSFSEGNDDDGDDVDDDDDDDNDELVFT